MRKNFLTTRGASCGAMFVALLLGSTFARASADFRIAIRDMDGAPLPGATIWFMGEAFSGKPVAAQTFADLVGRYGPDVDFMCSHGPVTELIIERADESGSLVLELESNEVRALKRSPLHMAVFKRGFAPKVLTAPHRVGGSHVMVIKLEPLATPADAKLLEFDRLQGSANLARLQGLGEPAGARESKRIRAALTALGGALHRDARDDAASVVYYGIACLPTVDYSEDASGIVVHGYTNGFSESDPWRVEARNLARQLNRSNPQLQFEAVLARYSPRGNLYIGDWMASDDRKRLIAEIEGLRARYGDRLWPQAYSVLWTAHVTEGDFAAGCKTIQAMYASMPEYKDAAGWQKMLRDYHGDVQYRDKSASANCALPGLGGPKSD
jgi:hypothetical protein